MSTKTTKLIVHISDIHICEDTTSSQLKLAQLCTSIGNYRYYSSEIIIVATGDITQSGKSLEFENAYFFFQELKEDLIKKHRFQSIDFCFCPGNHDLDFSQELGVRDFLIEQYIKNNNIKDDNVINEITKTQNNFFSFLENLYDRKINGLDRVSWYEIFNHQSKKIIIYSCNTSLTSQRREKQGELCLVSPSYQKHSPEDIIITITHHPEHWGKNHEYKQFRNKIRKHSDFLLTGHEHEFSSFEVVSDDYSCTIIESGVFWAPYNHTSSFNIIYIQNNSYDVIELKYNEEIDSYIASRDIQLENLKEISSKKDTDLDTFFLNFLHDAGADFTHPRKEKIDINDIYIWPELRVENSKNINILKIDSQRLFETDNKNKVIIGTELSGKTSLSKKIFLQRIKEGKSPIYIDCKSYSSTGNHKLDIKPQIIKIYGNEYERILSKSSKDRIIIFDNFDQLVKKRNLDIGDLLDFSKHFAHENIILTSKSLEELSLIDEAKFNSIGDFESYTILEFGPTKRYDLAKKWVSIGNNSNSINIDQHFDSIEKDLQTAVGKKLIPSFPIFLLTLIQASESRSAPDLKGSAFGHYYQFLITNSLAKANIHQQQYDEYFHFCSILANEIFQTSSKEINEYDFSNLIKKYSDSYIKISQYHRTNDLKKANILTEQVDEKGATYRFKYPYLYYFFIGKYLSDNIHDEVEKIKNLSKNLHISDNAQILLFLSHFNKDKLVYESIISEIKNCFEDFNEFNIDIGSTLINKLINDIDYKQIELSINEDRDLRRDLRASEEEESLVNATQISVAPTTPESIETISNPDQLNVSEITNWSSRVNKLFRSIEIMGQFIKNHYGSTKNETKNDIIKEVISSALRCLESFIQKCNEEKISIPTLVERILEDELSNLSKEEKSVRIRQASFNVIGMISYAFINKVASALASEFIIENLENVSKDNSNISYKVIDLAQNFELPRKLSFEKVDFLTKNFEKNVFAINMVRTLAYRHLHLYKIDYKERQKISKSLNISIKSQRIAADKRI